VTAAKAADDAYLCNLLLLRPYLDEASLHLARIVRAFQDRLAGAIESALGVRFSGRLFEVTPAPVQAPDVRIDRTFDTPRFFRRFAQRYGGRVIEPDIKLIFWALFGIMLLATLGNSQAVLPVFILGLALSKTFAEQKDLQRKLRVIASGIVTPFFFLKGGMNVSLAALATSAGLIGILFVLKMGAKFAGVYPLALRYLPKRATYTTLLMSTGLTFGTISSLYGLQAGYIDKTQFTVLVTVVITTAVIPTVVAQRFFQPPLPAVAPAGAEAAGLGEASGLAEAVSSGAEAPMMGVEIQASGTEAPAEQPEGQEESMFPKILVANDESEHARRALTTAIGLAKC